MQRKKSQANAKKNCPQLGFRDGSDLLWIAMTKRRIVETSSERWISRLLLDRDKSKDRDDHPRGADQRRFEGGS